MQNISATFSRYLQKEWFVIVLVLLSPVLAFKTLFFTGYFNHHDDLQVMRIFEMEKCFKDGQIPCRWVPDMGFGYGYPLFNFYPPFPAFVGVAIRAVTPLQIVDTVKVTFAVQILVSAVLMYLFAKQWWGRLGGFLASIFYTYAPYHALDLYVRGAYNEAWGMAFAPGVGFAMTRLWRSPTTDNVVLLALMTAGMLLTHNVMVMIFAPLFAIFAIFLVIEKRSPKLLAHFAAGGVLAVMLAAFFTLPSVLEQKYVHIDTLFNGFFNFTVHFVTLNQMFISRFWGYGGSTYGPIDQMAFPIGWLHWGSVVLLMIAGFWFLYKRNWKVVSILLIFGSYFWLTAFLAHEQSYAPLWTKLPILKILQFPWRFLSTVTFTASFLIGALFLLPLSKMIRKTLFIGLLMSVIAINIQFFQVEHIYPEVNDKHKLSGQLWDIQRTAGIFDYLPMYAVVPPGRPAPDDYQIMEGDVMVQNYASGSASARFQSRATTPSVVRLNIFDFPTWKVFIDGKKVEHNHENYLALITIPVPPGEHTVEAKLTNTPLRTLSNAISLFTVIGLSGLYLYKVYKRKVQSAKVKVTT